MDRTSSSHCPTASPLHVIVTSDLPWQPIGQQMGGWGMGHGEGEGEGVPKQAPDQV